MCCNAYEYTSGLKHTLWYALTVAEVKFNFDLSRCEAVSKSKRVPIMPYFLTRVLTQSKEALSASSFSVACQIMLAATIMEKQHVLELPRLAHPPFKGAASSNPEVLNVSLVKICFG